MRYSKTPGGCFRFGQWTSCPRTPKQRFPDWVDNPAVRIESAAIRPRVVLTPLDRLEESPALRTPRQQVIEWLPHATLPEPLQEVHRWTGFAEAFTHASEGADRT